VFRGLLVIAVTKIPQNRLALTPILKRNLQAACCRVAYLDIETPPLQAQVHKLLKKDVFGRILSVSDAAGRSILRDASCARPGARIVARWLLAREARALAALEELDEVPGVLDRKKYSLHRSYIDGDVMYRIRPENPAYFRMAAGLLRRMHRLGVVHNDLAKEANWLVTSGGEPALVDFQLAWHRPKRGYLFRILGREDLRHLLKHKRTYCPASLTKRELDILDKPALISRIWMLTGKKLYLLITRRLLGWEERNGAEERS
jgi:predicted Ser/Thr protein kinase